MLRFKRMCDVLGSIACMIILSPLLLLTGIITKLTIQGTVLFTQTRVGYLQKEFEIFKFRTMPENVLQKNPAGEEEAEERIPPFGRFLRRSKLDELPQLINILRGDMSFVGPRPYVREESIGLDPERYRMKPGLTGLGQVSGNRTLDWEERTAFDVDYIRHYSLWLDIKILLKTFRVVLRGEHPPVQNSGHGAWKDFQWYCADIRPRMVRDRDLHGEKTGEADRKSRRYSGRETDISLEAGIGQGKVTDCGYDRFPCIYTRIPANRDFRFEAEVTVISFLHEPGPNLRESFGIFARDTLEPDPYTGEYYGNMAAVGGYYGRYNFFGRTGITPDSIEHVRNFFLYPGIGEGTDAFASDPLQYRICPDQPVRMRMIMQRSGSRMIARMTDMEGNDLLSLSRGGGEGAAAPDGRVTVSDDGYSVSMPGAFCSRDTKWTYVGFETADGSSLLVHKDSVRITLDKTTADAAGNMEKDRMSARVGSMEKGRLSAAAGSMEKSRMSVIAENVEKHRMTVAAGTSSPEGIRHQAQEVSSAAGGNNGTEDSTEVRTWIVTAEDTSAAAGTENSPMSLRTAVNHCRPGDTVLVKEGRYLLDASVCLEEAEHGGDERQRVLIGENAHVILDFQGTANALIVRGDGWVIDGISVTRGHGIRIEGSHNTIRNCRAFQNLETGILIRHPDISAPRDEWPCGNVVEDCVSYENRDPSECNADGFACKVAAGEGNCFRHCVSWLNTDDGFDLFTKNRKIGSVTLEQCRSYLNGCRIGEDGKLMPTAGNGNGFKLGGSGLAVRHHVKECIAAGNKRNGFTSNSNPVMVLEDCSAYQNGRKNCIYFFYAAGKVVPEKAFPGCRFEDLPSLDAEALWKDLRDRYAR